MTTWNLFRNSKDAWEALFVDCERAERSIDLEQYIVHDDAIGRRLFALLEAKARAGVQVRLLCDMVGSSDFYRSIQVKKLRSAGVEIFFVHPISFWRLKNLTSWFFRDHRKLWIIDGSIGYTGGVNLGAAYAEWRDTQIRILGPAVEQMRAEFERMWTGVSQHHFARSRSPHDVRDEFMLVANAPRIRQRHFYHVLLRAIRKAESSVYLTTPYYIPPIRILRALQKAAHRGVDVRLLVPITSDIWMVDLASHSFFGVTMKSGIRLFRYEGEIIHAKTFIIDDRWAAVGSSNLDSQSFSFSYEANLITTNPACVEELRGHFFEDMKKSKELDASIWEQRSLWRRFLEPLTWPIHWIL
ncbi:MAG: phospholipase D-like domain-containing protein [Patescibacteria group bacterium]